ncbi:MAG: S-adenosylmethionine synthetase [Clostridia bacterium]|nr:S-adenosylmethionine synthetase [Clostridia bacterium]
MFEKVNPSHPDKVADRIAGAIVDLAYKKNENPKVACEVLIGHGHCHIINETSEHFTKGEITAIVRRIAGEMIVDYKEYKQDAHLAQNQSNGLRCGDNGIFKGITATKEQVLLSKIARDIYSKYSSYDGKYILDAARGRLIICQSNANGVELKKDFPTAIINPLGDWEGGTDVDTGATNRKLGSDMGDAVTGGGLHGKDLSKADVSVNIYAFIKAHSGCKQLAPDERKLVEISCAIGDGTVDGKPYSEIVKIAKAFIEAQGGFEKFAEWGLI